MVGRGMGSGKPENQLQGMAGQGQAARMVKQQAFRLGYFNVSDWLVKAQSANPVGFGDGADGESSKSTI